MTFASIAFALPAQAGSVTNVLAVTNLFGTEQEYTITTSRPLDPEEMVDQFFATSASLSLLDADGDGFARLRSVGDQPIVQALIDGDPVLDLIPGPEELSCSVAGCIDTLTVGPLAGALTPETAGLLTLTFHFLLSPGDSVTGLGRFEVVPEPATALLLVGGLAAMASRRRRP